MAEYVWQAKAALKSAWSMVLYMGEARCSDPAIEIIDEGIASDKCWACVYVSLCMQRVLTDCMTWSEDCPCHEHLGVVSHTRSQWQAAYHRELREPLSSTTTCPRKGMRAPEMATGA